MRPTVAAAALGLCILGSFLADDVEAVESGVAVSGAAESSTSGEGGSPVLEVVVTAEKKRERIQDVPVPITAVSAAQLVENNQLRLQDYFSSVPGLNLINLGTGVQTVTIRGLNSGGGFPAVAILVDDVPVSTSSPIAGSGGFIPDLDPSDMQRIEVLRGPQGTLYGASSIGGLLKYVTQDPSTESVGGRIELTMNGIHNGDKLGYGSRASVNLPVTDTFAVRVSGFGRSDPGYIDDPAQGKKGVNSDRVYGGRLSALWSPSSDFSIKLSALINNTIADGVSIVFAGSPYGDLQQGYLPNTGAWSTRLQLYNANIHAKVGGVDLTSITSYGINKGVLTQDLIGLGPLYNNGSNEKFTQEIRLSSRIGKVDWLIGGFFEHENNPFYQSLLNLDPNTGAVLGEPLITLNFPVTYQEIAGFANLTVHFTDRFDLQMGGREGSNKQTYNQTDTGPLVPFFDPGQTSPYVHPEIHSSDSSFTYLFTPRFKISPDLMTYVRVASGYQPGGPNAGGNVFGAPPEFKPATATSYDLGLKGDVLEHKVSFDMALFYIDWTDIQINILAPTGAFYFGNGSRAKSQGVELSGQANPLGGLTIAAWVAFNDAVLTEDFPPGSTVSGKKGDRLPGSSRFSGNLSVEEQFGLTQNWSALVRASIDYIGERAAGITSDISAPEQALPPYAQTNLLFGLRSGKWSINCFANNITDRRGILSTNPGPPIQNTVIQPRTIGLSVARTF